MDFGQTKELTASETLNVDSTDYYGSLTAENGEAKIYNFGGGYCTFDGACKFHYFDRDHQGNVRAVVSTAGTIEQIMNYYPFGAPYCDNTTLNPDLQPYKYNGKEFETMHGRNAYDYGARLYDPLLPTWDRMDPLCEKYYHISPYAYCANDPVNRIDLNGDDWISAQYNDELFVYYDSRIESEEDINKFYYNGGRNTNISYVGRSGRITQYTESGEELLFKLGEDGSISNADGEFLTEEYSSDGSKLHVGSDQLEKDAKYSHNWYGTYLGPNNPQIYIGGDKRKYLYSIPPIDELDYAAFSHDKSYDKYEANGSFDALVKTNVKNADVALSGQTLNVMFNSNPFSYKWWWAFGTVTTFSFISLYKHFLPW